MASLRDQPEVKAVETQPILMVVRKQAVLADPQEVAMFQDRYKRSLQDQAGLKTPDLVIHLHLLIPLLQVHQAVVLEEVQVVEWAVQAAADQQEVADNLLTRHL